MEDRVTILPPPPSASLFARAAVARFVRRVRRRLAWEGLRAMALVRRARERAHAAARDAAQAIVSVLEGAPTLPPEPGPVLPGGERVSALVTRLLAEQAARTERPTCVEVRRGAVSEA